MTNDEARSPKLKGARLRAILFTFIFIPTSLLPFIA